MGGIEQRRRERRSSGQQVGSLIPVLGREQRLEQLAHNPIGEGALELRAACTQHPQPRRPPPPLSRRDQSRLADPRWALDRQQPATAARGADQLLDRSQLRLALEQLLLASQ